MDGGAEAGDRVGRAAAVEAAALSFWLCPNINKRSCRHIFVLLVLMSVQVVDGFL